MQFPVRTSHFLHAATFSQVAAGVKICYNGLKLATDTPQTTIFHLLSFILIFKQYFCSYSTLLQNCMFAAAFCSNAMENLGATFDILKIHLNMYQNQP